MLTKNGDFKNGLKNGEVSVSIKHIDAISTIYKLSINLLGSGIICG